jgi:hypothetical protein
MSHKACRLVQGHSRQIIALCLVHGKGLPPLRTQGSPLRSDPFLRCRYGMDKPLTSFTPLFNRAIIGLSPKALS